MDAKQSAIGKFLDPELIISQLDVQNGAIAVDFGCGPGYFSMPFAKAVGTDGKVFSLDILPQALETVASKAKNEGITNIETHRVNLERENGSKMPDNSVDWVIMKDVLFQNKNKEIIITEAQRILKPEGKVIVVEWNQEENTFGPEMEIRIEQDGLKKMFEQKGFLIEKNVDAGNFHYAFVAKK
ncbi:MAG: methyltransferase type 11 [uncultured bacterium]|nr:MAG: methyltransferase type 11 [uncultured bacterium]